MDVKDLFSLVDITESGAILLGKTVVCDGYAEGRITALLTHIHKDHSGPLPTCLGRCDNVYVSKQTLDLLVALYGEIMRMKNNIEGLDYHDSRMPNSEKITLFESKHMLGCASVLVETNDNVKILYSGDFTAQDGPPTECDILVLDSTHGDPRFDTLVESESLERRFLELVEQVIQEGKPLCIHAHRGRLQYVMHLISKKLNPAVKFVADPDDIDLSKVYSKYSMPIRDIEREPYFAKKIFNGTYPYVEFKHDLQLSDREEAGMTRFFLIGSFGGKASIRQHDDNSFHLDFDEHAKFSSIIDYVKKCNPKVVVTDNFRTPHGETLADEIESQLNIPTKSLPEVE